MPTPRRLVTPRSISAPAAPTVVPAPAKAAVPVRRGKAPAHVAPKPAAAPVRGRTEIIYIDITDLIAYDYNPRDNAKAIAAVAQSIKTFGFLIPVVVGDNNVLIAGHTRVEAAKTLQLTEVPAVRASHLTPEEANAFLIIDNKVAEQAAWDFDLLA